MGDSLFIEPMRRWFGNRRQKRPSGEKVGAESPGEEAMAPPLEERPGSLPPVEVTPIPAAEFVVRPSSVSPGAGASPVASAQAPVVVEARPAANEAAPEKGGVQEPTVRPLGPANLRVASAKGEPEAVGGVARMRPEPQSEAKPTPGEEDSLSSSLKEIFRQKVVINPRVRALVERHGTVAARQLAEELHGFARSIGATQKQE